MEQSIINKIKALYQKAESAKELGSLEEANSFFEKVQDLLNKYNYSLEGILNHKTKEEIEYLKGKEDGIEFFHNIYEGFYWEPALMNSICRSNNVYSYKNQYSDKNWCRKQNLLPYITLVGTKSNKEICIHFYEMAKNIIRDLAGKAYEDRVKFLRSRYSVEAMDSEEAFYNILEGLSDWLESPLNALSSQYVEKIQLLKTLQKLVRYNEHKNLFMPTSYKESDLKDVQVWMLKDLVKANLITNRNTFIQSYLLGAANGVYNALKSKKMSFIKDLKEEEREQVVGLIHVKENELNKFVKDNLKGITTSESYSGDHFAFKQGHEDGSNLSFHQGINKGTGSFIQSLK